jgi:hypothetical protein
MPSDSRLLLIADDFEGIQYPYCYLLTQEGFRKEFATDGQDTVDKALPLQPDVISCSCGNIGGYLTTSTSTVVVPCFTKSNCSATASETSRSRFFEVGPWSLTVASTLLPFFVFVMRSLVPQGKVLCAVVSSEAT